MARDLFKAMRGMKVRSIRVKERLIKRKRVTSKQKTRNLFKRNPKQLQAEKQNQIWTLSFSKPELHRLQLGNLLPMIQTPHCCWSLRCYCRLVHTERLRDYHPCVVVWSGRIQNFCCTLRTITSRRYLISQETLTVDILYKQSLIMGWNTWWIQQV